MQPDAKWRGFSTGRNGRKGRTFRWRLAARLEGASRGQALIIMALSFLALLAFVGLLTDVGSLYVTYTQLKRAVDAAAVAAANNIKFQSVNETAAQQKVRITEAAREMLSLHNVADISSLQVYLCTDTSLPSEFAAVCPNISQGEAPRKLAWVQATQYAPVYFLHLFGVNSVPLTTSSIGEAATVDLVLVFDTSESMGSDVDCSDGSCTPGYDPNNFNPSACNTANDCYPLRQAKDAAKGLISSLFQGYDQVAIVTFDYSGKVVYPLSANIGDNDGADDGDAYAAIDHHVLLHDDAPSGLMPWANSGKTFNPIYPDDRDGDGFDADPAAPCTMYYDPSGYPSMWEKPDDTDPSTWIPCDDDNVRDVYDWNHDGIYGNDLQPGRDPEQVGTYEVTSLISTCTGCGIRIGTQVLKNGGRQGSVWVMIFLSDGVANLSDLHDTNPDVPSGFIYGFCGNDPNTSFWSTYCIDWNLPGSPSEGRYCIDQSSGTCPPGSKHTTKSGPYSVEDYALDMTDTAALLVSTNPKEPSGEDIVIYSIGLGAASAGEGILRYMADVGEDGIRDGVNSPCYGVPTKKNCGNYYYAPTGAYLDQIFENIAAQIFTKISR